MSSRYTIRWELETIEAESPADAAGIALDVLMDEDLVAPYLLVKDEFSGEKTIVDARTLEVVR